MTKKQKIVLAVASIVILAVMVVIALTGGTQKTKCPHCETFEPVACDKCDENHQVTVPCTVCNEETTVSCTNCGGTGSVSVYCESHAETATENCSACGGTGEVVGTFGTFWALLPPFIAIALALITKEVYSSLFVGILSGAILSGCYSFTSTLDNLTSNGLIDAVSGNAGIFIFLIELGILVALVNKAGGSAAFGKWASKHIKNKAGALLATFALGVLIFIDDYFNCLTVGSVMRPVTDAHKISRSKLSYIIDATAAPVCMIAPISSWAAAVSTYAEDGKGLDLFISAIPYNYYSLLTLVFVVAISIMGFDYGKMRIHEFNAQNGDLFSGEETSSHADEGTPNPKGKVIDLLFPIIVLIICSVLSLLYVGGILDGSDFVTAFADTDATVGLPMGGLVALLISIVYMLLRRVITFSETMEAFPKGFIAMVPAILILTMATALKNMTGLLGADFFVEDLLAGAGALSAFLPAVISLVACVIAFSTGTYWGTFGILIPIVTAVFEQGDPLYIIGISACLAGAVCGDHCSPISDTTIMSSAGARCNHLNHVSTQIPYAVSVAGISFVMYVIAGFVKNPWICLPIGVALTIGFLFVMKLIGKKKPIKA